MTGNERRSRRLRSGLLAALVFLLAIPAPTSAKPRPQTSVRALAYGIVVQGIIGGDDGAEATIIVDGSIEVVRVGDAIPRPGNSLKVVAIDANQSTVTVASPQGQTLKLHLGEAVREQAATVGALAPQFTLPMVNGNQVVRLDNWLGRPILINVWATWCPVCRRQLPSLEAAYRQYASKGLVILGLDVGYQGAARISDIITRAGVTYPVLEGDKEADRMYPSRAVPAHYFIDRRGVVRAFHVGYIYPEEMSAKLRKIL